ncbi:hypothetical protein [Rhizobium sp. BK060]|uniref:hypothetical protein n=1 Tax=Rhizobium sp. BK060 TaxID=2587096 RepID=UPI00161A2754|nr:hypothetical protein [Rhizobium sp. BK060]MBB3396884.1 hypothetical protein [Rhizobium sp. BK060]
MGTVNASDYGYVADYDSSTGIGTDNGPILSAILADPDIDRVICPSGLALLDNLEIPIGKTVEGSRPTLQTFLNGTYKPDGIQGTVWCTRATGNMVSGRPTNEQVRLNRGSLLKNLMLFHDGQPTPATGWTPIDTPWAVRAGRFEDNSRDVRAENARMEGVYALGYSHGIEFQKGGEGGYIRDCAWQAFKIGLSLDNIHHIILLDNVQAFPYWSCQADVNTYALNNYVAYEFGRIDGLRVKGGLFSIFTNVGVNFIPSRSTDFPGQPAYFFDIDAIYSDSCLHGLMVSPYISGAMLTGSIGQLIVQRTGNTTVVVDPASDYGVRLRGRCDISVEKFEGSGPGFVRPGGHITATNSGSYINIDKARICQWGSIPAFNFGVSGSKCRINSPVNVATATTAWSSYTGTIVAGNVTIAP